MKSEKLKKNIIIYLLITIIIFTLLFFVCITRQENNLVTLSRVVNTRALEVSKNENISIIGEKDINERALNSVLSIYPCLRIGAGCNKLS